jgi:hypothetical protein
MERSPGTRILPRQGLRAVGGGIPIGARMSRRTPGEVGFAFLGKGYPLIILGRIIKRPGAAQAPNPNWHVQIHMTLIASQNVGCMKGEGPTYRISPPAMRRYSSRYRTLALTCPFPGGSSEAPLIRP